MQKTILPMLAKDATIYSEGRVTTKHVGSNNFFVEKKYDGSRYILQRCPNGNVYLTSRTISVKTGTPVEKTDNLYGYLYENSKDMAGTILDGEVVAIDRMTGQIINGNGSSVVNQIMLSKPEKAMERLDASDLGIAYVAYDILFLKGEDVQNKPLKERKLLLEDALIHFDNAFNFRFTPRMILSDVVQGVTQAYIDSVIDSGYEWVMLKDIHSPYLQDGRKDYRMKVKKLLTEDGIIIGWTFGTGKYKDTLWALVIWQFIDGELEEVCTMSGMSDEQRHEFRKYFNDLDLADKATMDTRWYCMSREAIMSEGRIVEFIAQEKTKNRYRHPRFVQERFDKPIKDCIFIS